MVRESKKKETVTVESIEKWVLEAGSDHVQTFGGNYEGGIQCQQVADEISPCILAIMESGQTIKDYLEVGVAAGGTTALFNHFFAPERIVLIDDNRHPKAHVRQYILSGISRKEIIGNSQDSTTAIQAEGEFDIIIIDADHSYEGVSRDIANYKSKLKAGGFLILHDTHCTDCWGVHIAMNDLKLADDLEFIGEYITEKHSRPCGVGLFRKAVLSEGK